MFVLHANVRISYVWMFLINDTVNFYTIKIATCYNTVMRYRLRKQNPAVRNSIGRLFLQCLEYGKF